MYVFVYGTLKCGQCNHYLLEDSEFKGMVQLTDESFSVVDGPGYPVAKLHNSGTPIRGELYKITAATRTRLDWLEGYPNLYTRCLTQVRCNGRTYPAWIYYSTRPLTDRDELCPNGEWRLECGLCGMAGHSTSQCTYRYNGR